MSQTNSNKDMMARLAANLMRGVTATTTAPTFNSSSSAAPRTVPAAPRAQPQASSFAASSSASTSISLRLAPTTSNSASTSAMAADSATGLACLAEPHRQLSTSAEQDADNPGPEEPRNPANMVFNIYELLENILQRVSPRDILRLQSLNKEAENVVETSLELELDFTVRLYEDWRVEQGSRLSCIGFSIPLRPYFVKQSTKTGTVTIAFLALPDGVTESGVWRDHWPWEISTSKIDVSFRGYKRGWKEAIWGAYRYTLPIPYDGFRLGHLVDIVREVVQSHNLLNAQVHFNVPSNRIADGECGQVVRRVDGVALREDIPVHALRDTPYYPDTSIRRLQYPLRGSAAFVIPLGSRWHGEPMDGYQYEWNRSTRSFW